LITEKVREKKTIILWLDIKQKKKKAWTTSIKPESAKRSTD
jgi:hypothetical protein